MAAQPMTDQMTDDEFELHAMTILARELGPGGYARFIRLNRSGPGDYTAERHKWQADLTVESILEALKHNKPVPR